MNRNTQGNQVSHTIPIVWIHHAWCVEVDVQRADGGPSEAYRVLESFGTATTRPVGQALQPADSGAFPVGRAAGARNTGQECPGKPQTGMSALRCGRGIRISRSARGLFRFGPSGLFRSRFRPPFN